MEYLNNEATVPIYKKLEITSYKHHCANVQTLIVRDAYKLKYNYVRATFHLHSSTSVAYGVAEQFRFGLVPVSSVQLPSTQLKEKMIQVSIIYIFYSAICLGTHTLSDYNFHTAHTQLCEACCY